MDLLGPVTHNSRKVADDWNVIDWRAGDLAKLDTQIAMSYETGTSDANAPFTCTISNQPVPLPNTSTTMNVPKMRITNASGQAGGNTRRVFPIVGSTCKNAEMRALMLGRYRAAGSADQMSLQFRIGTDAANSNMPWAYVYWPDGIFGIESVWNMDWWRKNPTNGALVQGTTLSSGGGNLDFPGLQVYRSCVMGSKTGTTVTLQIGANHGIVAGDSIQVMTEEQDEYQPTVTAADQIRGTVTYTANSTATSNIYNIGIGRVMSRSILPYWCAARLVDDVFEGKCWRLGEAEPDWTTADNAVRMVNPTSGTAAGPQAAGLLGIGGAHLTNASHYVDYGTIYWRSLD